MDGRMDGWIDGWMDGWTNEWMEEWTEGWMDDAWTNICIHVDGCMVTWMDAQTDHEWPKMDGFYRLGGFDRCTCNYVCKPC